MHKKILAFFLIFALAAPSAWALSARNVQFHDEATDTARIDEMLVKVERKRLPAPGLMVAEFANGFLGKPYKAGTLEGDQERLVVNIDEFDCTTLVENAIAMALTVDERRTSWHDFIYNLERIRYRSGEIKGYPSRLHYISDWAVDNTFRGNFMDVTTRFPKYTHIVKCIDFMSENAAKYPALADSANLAGIKAVERGYRNYRMPYIKTMDLSNKEVKAEFKDGDILALLSNIKNLDVSHMGIVVVKDGEPYLLHASSSAGEVVVSSLPLAEFMKKNRRFIGVRVFRLQN